MAEEKFIIIQMDTGDEALKTTKLAVTASLAEVEDELLTLEIPRREDFATDEEYEQETKQFMLDVISDIRMLKKDLFCNVLNAYNSVLDTKRQIDEVVDRSVKESKAVSAYSKKHIQSSLLTTGIITICLPELFPLAFVIGGANVGYDVIMDKYGKKRVENLLKIQEDFKKTQYDFYDFTYDLRTDYHSSNKEMDELEKKAEDGENIIGPLSELLNPERMNLRRLKPEELAAFEEEAERFFTDDEEPKEYVKKDNN